MFAHYLARSLVRTSIVIQLVIRRPAVRGFIVDIYIQLPIYIFH
jgi:hypothetical protein